MMKDIVIGIDLGTTYSCVAVWIDGQVKIIPNENGNRITPSYVSFTKDERLIGDVAKEQVHLNPSGTIYDVKRLIGRKFSDPCIQKELSNYSYVIKADSDDNPVIEIGDKIYTPIQISAAILGRLKEYSETFLGRKIDKAVVTVPAYFNDSQKQATKDAGKIAGLDIIGIINEPTAGSLAYGLDKNNSADGKNILIFDLGGGTLDVSLLNIMDGTFFVKATSGDTHLGGEDFDNLLSDYFVKDILKKHDIDLRKIYKPDNKIFRKIKIQCEEIKKNLSSLSSTKVSIENIYDDIDYCVEISRSKFEDICQELFQKCLEPVKDVLNLTKSTRNSIDDIVLIGGSTRIPKIRSILKDFFGKEPCISINPDEAVAHGAAIQAALINKDDSIGTDLLLLDVASLSIGVETAGGQMAKIILRGSTIPIKKERIFSTYSDNQPSVKIKVYEGEREQVKNNHYIGCFELSGINPAPRGIPRIKVIFEIDVNGLLNITCIDESTRKSAHLAISDGIGRLKDDEVKRLLEDAEDNKKEDLRITDVKNIRHKIENYLYSLRNILNGEHGKKVLLDTDLIDINNNIINGFKILDEYNLNTAFDIYKKYLDDIQERCLSYIEKILQNNSEKYINEEKA